MREKIEEDKIWIGNGNMETFMEDAMLKVSIFLFKVACVVKIKLFFYGLILL